MRLAVDLLKGVKNAANFVPEMFVQIVLDGANWVTVEQTPLSHDFHGR